MIQDTKTSIRNASFGAFIFIPKSLLEIVVGQNKATIFYYYYSTKTMYTKAKKARQFFQCLKEFPFKVF